VFESFESLRWHQIFLNYPMARIISLTTLSNPLDVETAKRPARMGEYRVTSSRVPDHTKILELAVFPEKRVIYLITWEGGKADNLSGIIERISFAETSAKRANVSQNSPIPKDKDERLSLLPHLTTRQLALDY
jgi:hypothetical protein